MNKGKTIFSQLMSFLPIYEFNKCVKKHNGDYRVRTLKSLEHFYVMAFAQLTYRESLRDIEICLNAFSSKLYHSGFQQPVAKSTLAEANERRNWRIFSDFAMVLIKEARELYKDDNVFIIELNEVAYALDSSTIDLCLSLFPWAKFRKKKGAVKMHTVLDLRGSIPTCIYLTDGLFSDVKAMDFILFETGSIYVMDKAYIDFYRLWTLIDQQKAFFVTRAKTNMAYRRVYSRSVDKMLGLICDQTIKLTGPKTKKKYPNYLRRVKYRDIENGKVYEFLSNNFDLPAIVIAQLYKERWKIEIFFRWIKQNLRIKSFYGTSENAVFCQIWIAISTYLLIAIARKKLKIEEKLYTLFQAIGLAIFEKTPVNELFTNSDYKPIDVHDPNQLKIW